MPNITVQISKMSSEKKKELIEKLSAAASEATGIPVDKFVVFITEHERDSIGVGGVPLSEKMPK